MSRIYSNNFSQTSMYEYYILATENFYVGWKMARQYVENYSNNSNSGTISDWSIFHYEIKLYSTCLYDQQPW